MKNTSRNASFQGSRVARLGILAAVSAWLIAPAAFGQQYSSSADYHQQIETIMQYPYSNPGGYPRQTYNQENSTPSHFAFEVGGGFNAPAGYFSNIATWGGNFLIGAGVNFGKHLGILAEGQFDDNKIGGRYLSQPSVDVPGGNIHNWSATLEPIFYYKTTGKIGGYLIGGGGFYRRQTSFTVPGVGYVCYYYCGLGYVNVTVAHYSSNQAGANLGTGFTYKAFGEDSNAKLFMEARYTWVDSPKTNVYKIPDGTESLLPVTLGIRW